MKKLIKNEYKIWTDTLTEETYICQIMLKSHTTTHLLGCLQFQTLTTPNAGEDVENKNSHSFLVRLTVSHWTVYQFPIKLSMLLPEDPAIMLLGFYPSKVKIYPYKNMHMNVIGLYS